MSMGSYYVADYYRNPVPYTSSDVGEPVPGWGTTIEVAGPARLGVGALGQQLITPEVMEIARLTATRRAAEAAAAQDQYVAEGGTIVNGDRPTPWWIWPVAAAVILGGIGYVGTKQGWL